MLGQMSIFDFLSSVNDTFNALREYAKMGSLFRDGKKRIKEFFTENCVKQDRVKFLKKEYGIGGFSSCDKTPFKIKCGESNGSNIKIGYYDDNKILIEEIHTYSELADEIDFLLKNNLY